MSTISWIFVGLGIWLLLALFVICLARMAGNKTAFEQAREDAEQAEYIRQWHAARQ